MHWSLQSLGLLLGNVSIVVNLDGVIALLSDVKRFPNYIGWFWVFFFERGFLSEYMLFTKVQIWIQPLVIGAMFNFDSLYPVGNDINLQTFPAKWMYQFNMVKGQNNLITIIMFWTANY